MKGKREWELEPWGIESNWSIDVAAYSIRLELELESESSELAVCHSHNSQPHVSLIHSLYVSNSPRSTSTLNEKNNNDYNNNNNNI
jgi:hypothetical protein